jgi:hypothetical protein
MIPRALVFEGCGTKKAPASIMAAVYAGREIRQDIGDRPDTENT